ncbi:MAG: hypothetical protein EPN37_14100 [Chitinophagaceae bacterium]|nr:MAG: hypothetical protein EPN37_14100 [Chitinophagaceae bacterium]
MKSKKALPNNIDEYIAGFPEDVRAVLQQVRNTVKKAAPDAEETISYAMPAFKLYGKPLVYFAAFKNHIGFYPLPEGIKTFGKELAGYKTSKGAIQFPLSKPIPLNLITKITKFRMKENKT